MWCRIVSCRVVYVCVCVRARVRAIACKACNGTMENGSSVFFHMRMEYNTEESVLQVKPAMGQWNMGVAFSFTGAYERCIESVEYL